MAAHFQYRGVLFWLLLMVNVDGSTLRFSVEPPDKEEFSNDRGTNLKCAAEPSARVRWVLADGTSSVTNVTGLRVVFANGSLSLPAFPAEHFRQDVHSTVYRCLASNDLGGLLSREVRVKAVTVQPFDLYVYDTYVIKENTALFQCHIPNFLMEYVKVTSWIRDGAFSIQSEGIDSDGKYVILPNGDLVLRNADFKDAQTTFRCQAKHRLTGETKTSITSGKLFVTDPEGNVPPRCLAVMSEVTVMQGETTILPCIGNGRPLPQTSWFLKQNGHKEPFQPDFPRVRFVSGGLFFASATSKDSGQYVCQAASGTAKESVETTLKVLVPLSVSVSPEQLTAAVGSQVMLHCHVTGQGIREVRWLKNGLALTAADHATFSSDNNTLILNPVSFSHRGIYQCEARNEHTSASAAVHLLLADSVPTLSSSFATVEVHPGEAVTLSCTAKGNPSPTISWTLEDVPIAADRYSEWSPSPEAVIGSMNISRVAVEDGGVYACTARNRAGSVKHSAPVRVHGKLTSRTRPPVLAISGSTVWLNCPVFGYPIDSVTWEKGGDILPAHLRQTVLRNGTLRLEKVERGRDDGSYKCQAQNDRGDSVLGEVRVRIIVPPRITPFSLPEESVRAGARVRLQCVVWEGDEPLAIRWVKEGIPLSARNPEDDLFVREPDDFSSTLTLSAARPEHSGNYSCLASNEAGTDHYVVRIDVNVPPKWLVKPQDAFALLKSDVRLDCSAEGSPKPVIQWMKARGEDANSQRDLLVTNGHVAVLRNGSLLIRNVLQKHEGHYFCLASNGIGDGLSKATFLRVHAPARFKIPTKKEELKIDASATLSCEASGDVPINFTWIVDDKPINEVGTDKYLIHSRNNVTKDSAVSELTIGNVSRDDSKDITCVANNAFGKDELTINIVVLEPAETPVLEAVDPIANGSTRIRWKTAFDGNAPVTQVLVQYKKNDVNEWSAATNATLITPKDMVVVTGLIPFTTYDLRILAINEIGSSGFSQPKTFTTREEAPAGPPLEVEVESVDKKSLRVTWKPPLPQFWNGVIKSYRVGYKISDSVDAYVWVTIDLNGIEDELSHQLSDLNMYTQYSVVVLAVNGRGAGPPSKEIVVVTSEDVPSKAPENVRCSSLSTQTVYIIWDNLAAEDVSGILRGYKVFLKQVDEWSASPQHPQVRTTEVPRLTVQGLEVNTNYSFQVAAFTRVGDGVKSVPVYCKTHEDVPSAPGDIKVLPMSGSAVVVAWKPPTKPNGAITRYNVYARPVDEDEEVNPGTRYSKDAVAKPGVLDDTNVHSSKNDLVYEIYGLETGKRYEFWVTAVSVVGEGPRSRVTSQLPTGGTIAAHSASFDEVVRTPWKRDLSLPCRATGLPPPLKQWHKAGRPVNDNDRVSVTAEGALFIHKVRREDGGNYSCIIQNVYGTDEVTYAVLVLVPPPPPALGVYSKTASSLELKWQKAFSVDAPIRGYFLHFKKDKDEWEKVEVQPELDSYTLKNLICGAVYHLFLEALNTVGKGEPSDTITISTDGGAPVAPPKELLIREGSTFLSLQLDSWASASTCPIQHFVAEYRRADEQAWTVLSSEVKPSQKRLVVPGLVPGTWYHVRVTAHSNTGPTLAEYMCATLTQNGGTVPPPSPEMSEVIWLSLDWVLIAVSVLLALVLILVLIGLVCFRKRRTRHKRPMPSAGNPIHTSVESFVHLHGNNPPAARVYATLGREALSDNVDTYAYALPGGSVANSDYTTVTRVPSGRRSTATLATKPPMSQARFVESRPKSESAASSPAWTVYTNEAGPNTKTLPRHPPGSQNVDIKEIQSRPLPPTPQHAAVNNVPQETLFIFPDNSPSHTNTQKRRKMATFGRHECE